MYRKKDQPRSEEIMLCIHTVRGLHVMTVSNENIGGKGEGVISRE
jgi:hypothetical protein